MIKTFFQISKKLFLIIILTFIAVSVYSIFHLKPAVSKAEPVVKKNVTPKPIQLKTFKVLPANFGFGYTVKFPENFSKTDFAGDNTTTNTFPQFNYLNENKACNNRIYIQYLFKQPGDFREWKPQTFQTKNNLTFTKVHVDQDIYSWTLYAGGYFWIAGKKDCDNFEKIYDDALDSFQIITH